MTNLYELTDTGYSPSQEMPLPVEILPELRRVYIDTAPKPEVKAEPTFWSNVGMAGVEDKTGTSESSVLKKLFGLGGEERYQLWPEKIIREGTTAAGDVLSGKVPTMAIDPVTGDVHTSPEMIEKAQAISALAGSGGLGGVTDATLGATPFLRPALKHRDKLYKGKPLKGTKEDQGHQDIIPKELYEEFRRKAMSGEDLAEYNFGYMNDKGHFLNRKDALRYGIDTGIVDPQADKFGALTTTMFADSSKPGMAIEAVAKTAQPFYSALEHNVGQISQSKMTGEQWLGTLSNKPGVKSEEMQWTGLADFLAENKGKPVTKAQIEEHLASNKVELKEVTKGGEAGTKEKAFELAKEHGWKSWDEIDATTQAKYMQRASKEAGENSTKYHSYQLPGGENYREVLLTLPEKPLPIDQFAKQLYDQWGKKGGDKEWNQLTDVEKQPFVDNANKNGYLNTGENKYKSSHWDEPNILAHVRMNDRTIDGKKSLHLEEIQSDWHQQGRDKGYNVAPDTLRKSEKIMNVKDADPLFRSGLKQNGFDLDKIANEKLYVYDHNGVGGYSLKEPATNTTLKDWIESGNQGTGTVPDAPFKKTWHELALKRMIREAAEKGYDRLSWTPGEAQAARYDLSKSVDVISVSGPDKNGKYLTYIEGKDKQPLFRNQNGFSDYGQKVMTADELTNTVGKDVAKKLTEGAAKNKNNEKTNGFFNLKGEGLKIGGEGMKGFYDQMIPKYLEKLGKEHGVKVKKGEVNDKFIIKNKYGIEARGGKTEAEAAEALKAKPANEGWKVEKESNPVFYIDIPTTLKDQALNRGFPLFTSGGYLLLPVVGNPFASENKK